MKEKEIIGETLKFLKSSKPLTELDDFIVWQPPFYGKLRTDIFGVFDLVLVFRSGGVYFLQCTTYANRAARRRKICNFFEEVKMKVPNSYIFAWDEKVKSFVVERVD